MRRAKGEDSVTKRKDGRWQARCTASGKRRHVYGKTASRSTVRIRARERYEQVCRNHIVPESGHLKLRNLTPVAVQDLYGRNLGRSWDRC